jgi:hypothetical protein
VTYAPFILAALQALLGIVVKVATDGRERGKVRGLRHLLELYSSATLAQQERMDPLVNAAIDDLVEFGKARLGRKISGSGVAAVAFVSLILAGCTWLLLLWGFSIDSGWRFVVFTATGLFVSVSLAIVIAGLPTIYETNKPEEETDADADPGQRVESITAS